MREQAAHRVLQMLAATLARMNPAMKDALAARLQEIGVNVPNLARGEGGEELLKVMGHRFAAMQQAFVGGGATSGGGASQPRASSGRISLDKAWHGIHYLLIGQVEPDGTPLGQVILGGTEIGDDDLGYGPARYFTQADVATTAGELGATTLGPQMQARFDPAQMVSLEIYPGGWSPSGLNWLMDEYRNLRGFFADASAHQSAVITCLT
jgi:hypothetical protein